MEGMEEATACRPAGDYAVAKGRRTKRQRLSLLPAASTSSAEVSGSTTTTEEEEDMANCLILLAQGRAVDGCRKQEGVGGGSPEKFTSRRFAEAATTTNGKAGFYVYECKTCSKCFPSFQALGGHRASHRKPKVSSMPAGPAMGGAEEKKAAGEDGLELSMNSFSKHFTTNTNTNTNTNTSSSKQRVHECSICGAEFSSGQALGGHMRRHRPASAPESKKEERNVQLSLDLNLPAPSEDGNDFSLVPFGFSGEQSKSIVIFSASALVDCHY